MINHIDCLLVLSKEIQYGGVVVLAPNKLLVPLRSILVLTTTSSVNCCATARSAAKNKPDTAIISDVVRRVGMVISGPNILINPEDKMLYYHWWHNNLK